MNSSLEDVYTFANVFEKVRNNNYDLNRKNSIQGDSKITFFTILNNYLQSIISEKIDIDGITVKTKTLAERIIEHITGDYEIGVGDIDFEELTENSEIISSVVAYSNENGLRQLLSDGNINELADGIVDGVVASDLINSEYQEKAINNFRLSSEKVKAFFKNSIHNITHLNEKVTDLIAHIAKMDTEESKELNSNIAGKAIGGIAYVLFSGTLMKKRHFTPVTNSKSMLEQIEKEGILHFTSPETAGKIMKNKTIKTSPFLESDATRKKCFFFAGAPTFEDLVINIPAYDVMTAVKINPTEEQMQQLKYRALNDRAVVQDGDFQIEEGQAEIVYYGLMYDKEKRGIYLGKLTEEEAKDFQVSEEVRNAYHYVGKKSTLLDNIKLNAYGFYAEYKHHQKLLRMEAALRERGINDFRNVNDETLVELADIERAYIDTADKSVARRRLFEIIKSGLTRRRKENIQERKDGEIVH